MILSRLIIIITLLKINNLKSFRRYTFFNFQKGELYMKGLKDMKIFMNRFIKNITCIVEFVYLYVLLSFIELKAALLKSLQIK